MYGITSAACGGPRTSWSGKTDDPDEPSLLLKRLDASAKGCQWQIDQWRALGERIENEMGWQSHDRLKAIRLLGKQPVDVAEDKRIIQIFVGSYALNPIGRNAYDDLQADMGTLTMKRFLRRVRSRWPLVLDASDADTAKATLLDLVAETSSGWKRSWKSTSHTHPSVLREPAPASDSTRRRKASGCGATSWPATGGCIAALPGSGSTGEKQERRWKTAEGGWRSQKATWCSKLMATRARNCCELTGNRRSKTKT